MSAVGGLLAVVSELDQRAAHDPGVAKALGALYPVYPDARSWTAKLVTLHNWQPLPSTAEALGWFAEAATAVHHRTRWLTAMLALHHLQSGDPTGSTHRPLLVAAITPLTVDASSEQAAAILHVVERESDADLRFEVVADSIADGLDPVVGSLDRALVGPPPSACDPDLISMPSDDGSDPVLVLESSHVFPSLSLSDVELLLMPENWPKCSDFFCSMTRINPGVSPPRYTEVVSTDCGGTGYRATTCLEFEHINLAVGTPGTKSGASTTYRRCPDVEPAPGEITVDDGSLTAREQPGGGVELHVTKRIRFTPPFDGYAAGAFVCFTEWDSVVIDMVSCLAAKKGSEDPTTPPDDAVKTFPDDAPLKEVDNVSDVNPGSEPAPDDDKPDDGVPPSYDQAVADSVDTAKACIDECAAAYKTAYEKVKAGGYDADTMVNDMAAAWMRVMKDAASVVTTGLNLAQAVAADTAKAAAEVQKKSAS